MTRLVEEVAADRSAEEPRLLVEFAEAVATDSLVPRDTRKSGTVRRGGHSSPSAVLCSG